MCVCVCVCARAGWTHFRSFPRAVPLPPLLPLVVPDTGTPNRWPVHHSSQSGISSDSPAHLRVFLPNLFVFVLFSLLPLFQLCCQLCCNPPCTVPSPHTSPPHTQKFPSTLLVPSHTHKHTYEVFYSHVSFLSPPCPPGEKIVLDPLLISSPSSPRPLVCLSVATPSTSTQPVLHLRWVLVLVFMEHAHTVSFPFFFFLAFFPSKRRRLTEAKKKRGKQWEHHGCASWGGAQCCLVEASLHTTQHKQHKKSWA